MRSCAWEVAASRLLAVARHAVVIADLAERGVEGDHWRGRRRRRYSRSASAMKSCIKRSCCTQRSRRRLQSCRGIRAFSPMSGSVEAIRARSGDSTGSDRDTSRTPRTCPPIHIGTVKDPHSTSTAAFPRTLIERSQVRDASTKSCMGHAARRQTASCSLWDVSSPRAKSASEALAGVEGTTSRGPAQLLAQAARRAVLAGVGEKPACDRG